LTTGLKSKSESEATAMSKQGKTSDGKSGNPEGPEGSPTGGAYCYRYPRPAVTIDLAVLALDGDQLRVLLIRRKKEPFAGRWALPGGFLDIDEPVEAGARRELREETGLDVAGPVEFLGVYADPGRDPRGRTITLAHALVTRGPLPIVAGGDDAEDAAWLDPKQPLALAFDHDKILADALAWVRRRVAEGADDPGFSSASHPGR
jgi:8-oxo-dGTP diphosphatase